ncbi:TonB-dependent receptor plug domain-containing protein, partial [Sporomusa sp.]|uniref:TonB-dependent receptor plug domain-containing protein n=1 Tax=Sporomusa sp. TaxID=2078658 RepID=UPI002C80EEB2
MKKGKSKKQMNAWLCAMVASALLWQAPGAAYAEEVDEYEFDQMVVTATKTPVKQSEANANISVITKEKIEQQHYTDLEQALRDVPGVTILNYGRAGYNLSNGLRINGSPKVLVLVDGVSAGHADITFPASAYMALENIERIEVLKGSASAIYGSDAKGGVINIITRKPQGDKSYLSISGGNFSRENYSFAKEGVAGDWAYRVTAKKSLLGDAEDGRGRTIPQSLNADALGFKITKSFKEGSDLALSYNSYKSDWMYYDAAYGGGITRGTSEDYDWSIVFNHEFDNSASNTFTFKNSHYDYVAPTWTRNVNTLNIADQFTKKINDRHTVITGFDYTRDKVISSG